MPRLEHFPDCPMHAGHREGCTCADGGKSCFNCAHLEKETESWEMPWIYWYECIVRPQNSMLKQFPFRRTKCSVWHPKRHISICNLGEVFGMPTKSEEAP